MHSEELERKLGGRIRALRVARRLTQTELAELANVSVGALKHLEGGAGATTTTLVKVLRALDQERWIDTLGRAPEAFNPLRALEARQRAAMPARATRVRHRRTEAP
ncbi:MAG: helix-turn-helix transcriptional regulator [Actinomycetota bacterium]|jgi:transcriptional regulator with XRE-family HTH domain|nr:helix-turn-helix transcriptional regulator [Actinomycetota bacterium]